MRKIPTLFQRDWDGDRRYVLPEVTPGCEWVLKGEGVPTRKYDGTCVMYAQDGWWARREVKAGKTAPGPFREIERDPETGKTIGWADANESGFFRYLMEALEGLAALPYGTYELCGPKVNANPEGLERHTLIAHDAAEAPKSAARLRRAGRVAPRPPVRGDRVPSPGRAHGQDQAARLPGASPVSWPQSSLEGQQRPGPPAGAFRVCSP